MGSFRSRSCIAQPVRRFEWPLTVGDDGILYTPLSTRLPYSPPSFPFFPFRCLDSTPFFPPGRFEDGILPTPHHSTHLPSPPFLRRSDSSLRHSGSSLRRSGSPQKASPTPLSRSAPVTLRVHYLSFSQLPPPLLPSPSPHLPNASLHFIPSSPLCPRCSRPFTLFFTFVKSPGGSVHCAMSCPSCALWPSRHQLRLSS